MTYINREKKNARKHEAWDLRIKGKTYRQIGEILGISHGTAENWCKEVMAEISLPLAEEVRKQELARLTRLLDKLEFRVEQGDDKAVGLVVKISESIRKMLGIDIPVTQQIAVTETTQQDLEIVDLIARMKAQNELDKARISGLDPNSPEN